MKLAKEMKTILDALAFAYAGENLSVREKARVVAGAKVQSRQIAPAVNAIGPQVGLYMGSELPADVMNYVIQTCARLHHGLTVLTLQSEEEARSLIAPYQTTLDECKIPLRVNTMSGDPVAALSRALRRLPEVAFLVCNESGYLGYGLLNGTQHKDAFPVPVVMVAAKRDSVGGSAVDNNVDARSAHAK